MIGVDAAGNEMFKVWCLFGNCRKMSTGAARRRPGTSTPPPYCPPKPSQTHKINQNKSMNYFKEKEEEKEEEEEEEEEEGVEEEPRTGASTLQA